jgi:hypothetical protein
MFVLCLLYKDGSMERKVTWRTKKDLNSTKMDQRGKTPDRQKKNPGSVHVGFMVDKVAWGQVFPRVLRFSPVSFIPPVLHYLEKWKNWSSFSSLQGCTISPKAAVRP